MSKLLIITAVLILTVSCGKSHKPLEREVAPATLATPLESIDSIVSKISYPSTNIMEYNGEIIADLSSNSPISSSLGTVTQGMTLNYITISGVQFLVYGEDGVFATECEPNALYPDHNSLNAKCEMAHAENYDKIILCTSRTTNVDLSIAQNWPGSQTAMEDESRGMVCYVNGVKMLSSKIFTY